MFKLSYALFAFVGAAGGVHAASVSQPFGKIKNLVQFGDSYTDSTVYVPTGGTTWGQYVAAYAHLELYNFAISGATCDNRTTPRIYPDITKNELDNYYNLTKYVKLNPKETLYTIWIGTNDVGGDQLITGQAKGDLVDVTSCAVNTIKTLYDHGGRNFLFQNMVPLDKAPMYTANAYPDRYWTAPRNTTQWNIMMKELVNSGNKLTELMVADLAPKLPQVKIGYFDSHAFFNDIIAHPSNYLNGTAPLNITGAVDACVFAENGTAPLYCTVASGSDKDSFLWFDELHPSEQADRVLAREVTNVIQKGSTKFTRFY